MAQQNSAISLMDIDQHSEKKVFCILEPKQLDLSKYEQTVCLQRRLKNLIAKPHILTATLVIGLNDYHWRCVIK